MDHIGTLTGNSLPSSFNFQPLTRHCFFPTFFSPLSSFIILYIFFIIFVILGVDLSSARISICKTVIKKYFHLKGLDGCAARLFLTDGSTFSVLAPQSKFGSRKSSALTRGRKKEQSRVKEEEDKKQEGEDESGRRRKGVKANLQSDPDTKATQTSLATNDLPPITSPDMTQITTTQTTSTQNIISQTTTSETTTTSNPIPPPMQSPSSLISITNTLPSPPALPNPLPSLSEDMSPPPTQKKTKKRRKGRDKDLPDLYFSNDYSIRIPETGAVQLYDRILVDAECTLDASVRHLLMYPTLSFPLHLFSLFLFYFVASSPFFFFCLDLSDTPRHSKKSPKLTTTPELTELQRRLITNAFQLLKPGGTMVYSTCSFCESQNEDIVRYTPLLFFPSLSLPHTPRCLSRKGSLSVTKCFPVNLSSPLLSLFSYSSLLTFSSRYLLEHFPSALVVPIPLPVATSPVPWSEGSLQHTVRLYPRHSGTSGMFIAKIIKLQPPS